jgi:hypothetical protein
MTGRNWPAPVSEHGTAEEWRRTPRTLAIIFSLIWLFLGLFVIPYFVPRSGALLSASSLAGFNNSLAYLWYVLFLGLPVYLLARALPASAGPLEAPASQRLSWVPTKAVSLTMGLHILLFAALYAVKHGFVFAEALYFQDLIYRMTAGAIPFLDVHFFYGPALLYPAAFLARYVSIEAAYAAYYVVTYLAGLYLLYVVLAWMVPVRQEADGWFLVFALGFFNPYTGINYTFVRHLLPAVTLLAAWRHLQSPSLARLAGTLALFAWALTYSPEIGVVTLISVVTLSVLWLARFHQRKRVGTALAMLTAVPGGGLILCGFLFYFVDPSLEALRHYTQPIVTFSSGGWNTPIDPSFPMLTMIVLTVVVGAAGLRTIQGHGWSGSTSWLVAYGIMLLLMQRAAFGKADVAHIAYGGLPLYLLSVRYAPSLLNGPIGRKWLTASLLVGMIGPLQFFHAMQYAPFLEKQFMHSLVASASRSSAGGAQDKEAIQASIAKAVEHFGPDRIYYMHKLEYYRLPIYMRFHLKPGLYFPSLTSAFTREDMEAVIQDLRRTRAIVVALRRDLVDKPHVGNASRHWLYYLTSAPLPGSSVFDLTVQFQAKLEEPLMEFFESFYEVRFEDGEIVGLVPRNL